jgi:chemotaxis methyl-accepting protein methylase
VEALALLQSLNVGYSEFFRSPLTFALLEQWVLPGLAAARGTRRPQELRVWSAGCAAGQEAWSIAILLEELAAARAEAFSFRVIATDISKPALALAREGVYNRGAMRNVALKHIGRYFVVEDGNYTVVPALRARVDFSTYDLLDERSVCPPESLYGDFDLILCCNVLLYYQPKARQVILDKLGRALSPGGYCATGETEQRIVGDARGFRAVAPPATVFQRLSERSQG